MDGETYVAVLKRHKLWNRPVFILGILVVALVAVCIGLGIVAARMSVPSEQGTEPGSEPGKVTGGQTTTNITIVKDSFGQTIDGENVDRYKLSNRAGMEVHIISLGATITVWKVPDRNGRSEDIVLGFQDVTGYEDRDIGVYFGAVVGRYANRIARGQFTLDGVTYKLKVNNGQNHLHGGSVGWDKALWRSEVGADYVTFLHSSPAGDESYPGAVEARVTYRLTYDNQLMITYRATSTAPTPINLSGHSYFNLAGEGSGNIYEHEVAIYADRYLPVDDGLIPVNDSCNTPVAGTAFDLLEPVKLEERLDPDSVELYDHNFCIRGPTGKRHVARVYHPGSGRVMNVYSNQPGLQFYTGNYVNVTQGGKHGHVYRRHDGFCMETQNYPDAPNRPGFPDSILRPSSTYVHEAWFAFSTL